MQITMKKRTEKSWYLRFAMNGFTIREHWLEIVEDLRNLGLIAEEHLTFEPHEQTSHFLDFTIASRF